MFRKLKGILGFCQWKGCWHRHTYELSIKGSSDKTLICKKHAWELLNDKSTKITNVEIDLDL